MSNLYNYRPIKDFGPKKINDPKSSPISTSLVNTMDKDFNNTYGILLGPYSKHSQIYMADKCSKNWDLTCSYFLNRPEPEYNSNFPNIYQPPNTVGDTLCGGLSVGQSMLRNAIHKRFCKYPNSNKVCEPYNPLKPDSPMVCYEQVPDGGGGGGNIAICTVDEKIIDQDPIMDKALQNPYIALPTLVNIAKTHQRLGKPLSDKTKIGRWANMYLKNEKEFKNRIKYNGCNC